MAKKSEEQKHLDDLYKRRDKLKDLAAYHKDSAYSEWCARKAVLLSAEIAKAQKQLDIVASQGRS